MPSIKVGSLSGTSTPLALMDWIKNKFLKTPKIKCTVLSAEQLIDETYATDWEIANLLFVELTAMGFSCKQMYLETRWSGVTHTVTLYRDSLNCWRWCEWNSSVDCGIYGPYNSMTDAVEAVKESFKANWMSHKFSAIGESVITEGMTADTYIEMTKTWKRPPRRKTPRKD